MSRPCDHPPTTEPETDPPYGTIVHYCHSNKPTSTFEERCGSVAMVIGAGSRGTLRVLRLWSFVGHRAESDITFVSLGVNHHIAEDNEA